MEEIEGSPKLLGCLPVKKDACCSCTLQTVVYVYGGAAVVCAILYSLSTFSQAVTALGGIKPAVGSGHYDAVKLMEILLDSLICVLGFTFGCYAWSAAGTFHGPAVDKTLASLAALTPALVGKTSFLLFIYRQPKFRREQFTRMVYSIRKILERPLTPEELLSVERQATFVILIRTVMCVVAIVVEAFLAGYAAHILWSLKYHMGEGDRLLLETGVSAQPLLDRRRESAGGRQTTEATAHSSANTYWNSPMNINPITSSGLFGNLSTSSTSPAVNPMTYLPPGNMSQTYASAFRPSRLPPGYMTVIVPQFVPATATPMVQGTGVAPVVPAPEAPPSNAKGLTSELRRFDDLPGNNGIYLSPEASSSNANNQPSNGTDIAAEAAAGKDVDL